MVNHNLQLYSQAKTKSEKTAIVSRIVNSIRVIITVRRRIPDNEGANNNEEGEGANDNEEGGEGVNDNEEGANDDNEEGQDEEVVIGGFVKMVNGQWYEVCKINTIKILFFG